MLDFNNERCPVNRGHGGKISPVLAQGIGVNLKFIESTYCTVGNTEVACPDSGDNMHLGEPVISSVAALSPWSLSSAAGLPKSVGGISMME